MKYDIKKVSNSDSHIWLEKKTKVDIESRYVNQLKEFFKEYRYENYAFKRLGRDAIASNSNTEDVMVTFFDMSYGHFEKTDASNNLKYLSVEVHQYDDDWFVLKFWNDYGSQREKIDVYICDQFDSVIHQLNECMKFFPKEGDDRKKEIEKELIKRKNNLIKKMTKHIMSFTDFGQIEDLEDII